MGRKCWKDEELIHHFQHLCAGKHQHQKKTETEDRLMEMPQPLTLQSE